MRNTIVCALSLFVFAPCAFAQDWNQWRGPARDGVVAAGRTPAAWPDAWKDAWRIDVGEGYASPVVAGGRVFIHSRKDPQEIVTAIDLATGKVLWQQSYAATFNKNQYAVQMAKGPNATPLVTGGRVFTLGVTGVLVAWDAATGKIVWQKDYSKTIDTSKLFCGTAASPLLAHGLVVVQVGSDVHGGQIIALDPATGEAKWEWKGLGPGYASPILADIAGTSHLITLTNGSIVGLDARTGRGLWSAPFPDEWHENIVTPTWTGTHLVVSTSRAGTQGFTIAKSGAAWTAAMAWKNAEAGMYMSSPVLADGVLYGFSARRKGQLVALDAKTGALKWATEGREGEHASVLLTPKHVVYLSNSGKLIVAKRDGQQFVSEKQYEIAKSQTWAVPVFLGADLIVRDATGVARLTGR